jgi:uncharacterized protein
MPTISMHSASVPLFVKGLNNLSAILDKAQEYIDAKKLDATALTEERLIADMLPFKRQVQVACDFAKGATARLAGVEVPAFEDNEVSIADLKGRIAKTLAFVQSVPAASFDGSEGRNIAVKMRGNDVSFDGLTYLTYMVLPNFYFHLTTAYALLRKNGIDIGKRDFIGTP